MKELVQAIRSACSARNWSQGVELVRRDAVLGEASGEDEVVLRVKAPGRPVALTVILYPRDLEWDCDCPSRETTCSHVAAAALALSQAREAGEALPSSSATARLRYKFEGDDRLRLDRALVSGDSERLLAGSLASLLARGADVAATSADLEVDRLLGSPPRHTLEPDLTAAILKALDPEADVRVGNRRARVGAEPALPRVTVRDRGEDIEVVIDRDPEVTEVVGPGLALCGDTVRALGETWLTGPVLEGLPHRRSYPRADWGELVSETLPALQARVPVTVRTRRLPGIERREPPRLLMQTEQAEGGLEVVPLLVYGDPPQARVDGDRLIHLQGDAPVRDRDAERRLVHRLRDEWNMAPGRRVRYGGNEALRMASRLAEWGGSVAGGGQRRARAPLQPRISIDGDRLEAWFELPGTGGDTGRADAGAVLRAWRGNLAMAPLEDGGWAPLPQDWLEKHGYRLADLLGARDEIHRTAPHALRDLAQLCADLDHPPPPGLERLAPLFEDFERLPQAELPDDLIAELRPYQRRGIDWLCFLRDNELGGVLADDMGLGKTLQAMCALNGRSLVICPTSVLYNWSDEIARFRPGLRVAVHHGPRRKLDLEADVVLTTYALLRLDADELAAVEWDAVVLDEAQAIKNPDSQVARAAYRLQAPFRLTLTGTPIENRLEELWSQLHFTNRGLLGGRADFDTRYSRPIASGEAPAAAALRDRIRPFVLRRLKREVAPELPPRTDSVLRVELDERERAVYDTVRAATQKEVLAMLEQGGGTMAALEALLRLRQASCHSGLVPGQKAESSSKIQLLLEALEDAVADGHKALVFSQWTSFLNLIEPHLTAAGIAFTRLDGSTRDRGGVVNTFQADDGPPVMLVSLKAGGTGLNLTAADHVFLMDPWWNPAVEDQAADRAHRIGQDRPVIVYRVVARDTVEERILGLQEHKRALAAAALAGTAGAAGLTRDDLMALLR